MDAAGNLSEGKMNPLVQHTEYSDPKAKMSTQYGLITIHQWLVYEAQRIIKKGAKAEIRRNGNGWAALYVTAMSKVNG